MKIIFLLETENTTGLGLGVQSVLWSDAEAFHALGEEAGNKAMFQLTEFAVKLCEAPVMKPGLFSVFAQKLPGKKFGKWGKIR